MRILVFVVLLTVAAPGQEAVLSFHVRWDGPAPKVTALVIPADFKKRNPEDAAFCGKCAEQGHLRNESLLVDRETGGIANVAISVGGAGASRPAPTIEPTLNNQGCRFEPRVQFVPLRQRLTVINSDPFVHNARMVGRGGRQFWNALIAAGSRAQTRPIEVGGMYTVHCDVHPWMRAYAIASSNPHVGVTDATGKTTVRGLPADRELTIDLWHESLGRARIVATLEDGKTSVKPLTQKDFRKR